MEHDTDKKEGVSRKRFGHICQGWCCGYGGGNWFGWLLVIIGAYLIFREIGWLPNIPFGPAVLILLGIFFLKKGKKK